MSSQKEKSDQCSVIKRLIIQHVMKERPDFAALVEKIQSHSWVIMKALPGVQEEANDAGQYMCEVVHAHGEFTIVRVCLFNSEPYVVGSHQFVIHLSRWAEYFVEFHTDFFKFAEACGGGTSTTMIAKKE